METINITLALLLTLLAGLSTSLGSLIVYTIKQPLPNFLSAILGFSAGVMLYVSFLELLPQGINIAGKNLALISFFLGIALIALIDFLVPAYKNPHEFKEASEMKKSKKPTLLRTSILLAITICIHNLPEGLATLFATLSNTRLGFAIAFAVALHNIPEGISVSIPIYYATKSRKKALLYSSLSGLTEPLGALLGLAILLPFITEKLLASTFAFVAGIMVYISLDELLPLAHKYGKEHTVIVGIIAGMLLMAASNIFF
ncbi:MAG: zinc transporter ZupT [Thermoplasmata archaeon]